MSEKSMTLTVLCTGLANAVAKDEAPEAGGFDLSAGMFGPSVSAWLREVADELCKRSSVQETPAVRTVWTKNIDSDPYCVHCGKTWDMHICDGRSSCPTANR